MTVHSYWPCPEARPWRKATGHRKIVGRCMRCLREELWQLHDWKEAGDPCCRFGANGSEAGSIGRLLASACPGDVSDRQDGTERGGKLRLCI